MSIEKKIIYILASLFAIANARAQVHVNDNLWYNNGAGVTVQSNCLVTVQGDVTNNQAGVSNITHLNNDGFIWVMGNIYGDDAFKQAGTGTLRLQNKTSLYAAPYAAEKYQTIQGAYNVKGGQAAIGQTNDGSFYNLELDNQNGTIFLKSNIDVRNTVDFKPASVTVDGIAIAPNGTANRILTYDPGTGAEAALPPANGAGYTTVFGMMNNAGGLAGFKNVSNNLTTNTAAPDNAYIQGKLRRAIDPSAGGSYGFPVGLEVSTSSAAARGIQYASLDFAANKYDVITAYFQQGSDNTVNNAGTVCNMNGAFVYYGASNHGEWVFTPQTESAAPYSITIFPQDYGTVASTKYFITKDNAIPLNASQSCAASPVGLRAGNLSGFSEFGFAGGSIALPFRLKSFYNANTNGINNTLLKWTTASEQNVKKFEIERSTDGVTWQRYAAINAAGNSATEKNYEYKVTLQPQLTYFFRLKAVDFDGTNSYSRTVKIAGVKKSAIKVFPNPVKKILHIRQLPAETSIIAVFNVLGQQVLKHIATGNSINISFTALPKGTYWVKIIDANGTTLHVHKAVK